MKNKSNKNKSKKLSYIIILGVPFITLFFDGRINDPFNVAKLIVLLLISSWLAVDLFLSYKLHPIQKKSLESKLFSLVIFFIVSQLISTTFTNNHVVALFGDTQRRNGFLTYFSLSLVFLYMVRNINKNNIVNIYKMLILTSSLVIFYSCLQISGNDFISWNNPYNRAISTLGNPNFTSAFLAMSFVASLSFLFYKKKFSPTKFLAVCILPLSVFVILSSGSRQGLYAISISILFSINVYVWVLNKKSKYFVSIFSTILMLASILGMLQKGPLANLLYKDSVSVRGFYWRAGIDMFLDHPLIGVGIDSYGQFFRQYKELDYVRRFGTELMSNNAHNTIIQLFATGGLFVGIANLFIVISVLFFSLKHIKNSNNINNSKEMLGLLSIYIAFQAQSFISIDNLGLTIWGWCIGGALIGLIISNADENILIKNNSALVKKVPNYYFWKPILHAIISAPVIIVCFLLYQSESNMYLLRDIANTNTSENQTISKLYAHKIIDNPVADPFLKLKASIYLSDAGNIDDSYKNLKLLSNKYSDNFEILWAIASTQAQLGEIDNAISTRLKITKLDPYNTNNYLILLKMYKSKNNAFEFQKMKDLILKFTPNSSIGKEALTIVLN